MTDIANGDHVRVTGGTHKGMSGAAQDRNVRKTGHVTITVRQDNGVCFKTLARNVRAGVRLYMPLVAAFATLAVLLFLSLVALDHSNIALD